MADTRVEEEPASECGAGCCCTTLSRSRGLQYCSVVTPANIVPYARGVSGGATWNVLSVEVGHVYGCTSRLTRFAVRNRSVNLPSGPGLLLPLCHSFVVRASTRSSKQS